MKFLASLTIILSISFTVLPGLVSAGDGGQYSGVTNCFIGGRWVTVRGNCPAPSGGGGTSGGGTSSGGGSGAAGALYGGFYSLGYAFGQWLAGGGSDPQEEARRRAMMEELQRRQAEAARQQREEEARRLAGIYNRLARTLKLSGTPELQLKGSAGGGQGLKLKVGDGAGGRAGIDGLPGIYLNSGGTPYGVPGLPGIYTGGPGQGSGLSASGLKLKIGGETAAAAPTTPTANAAPVPAVQAAPFNPADMTPQQLADIAEMVGRLPPEEQARLMTMAPKDAAGGPPVPEPAGTTVPGLSGQLPANAPASLQQQSVASQAAASAPTLEDASYQARAGFDRPLGSGPPVRLETTRTTPSIPVPSNRGPEGGIDADLEAKLRAKAEQDAFRAREAIDRSMPPGTTGRTVPPSPSPSPASPLPSQILRQEREALEPSLVARIEHEKSKVAAQAYAASVDKFIDDNYAAVNDKDAETRVSRLVERIKALSPYPDDPVKVRIYGPPKDRVAESGMSRFDAFSTSDTLYFNAAFLNRKPADDEILFVAGHELGHIQRDHYAGYLGASRREDMLDRGRTLLGAREVSSNPEVVDGIRQVRMHDLNESQELEAERFGTTMALAAGAKFDALRDRYARGMANENPRSAAAEQAADHPRWRRYYEEQGKIWGDLLKVP